MKWKNKGNEFEQYKMYFEGKQIFIYGAAERGCAVYEKLKFLNADKRIAGVIDRAGGYLSQIKGSES